MAPAVLQVLPRLEFGGVERGTADVSEGLVAAGWRSVVASAGGALVPEIERAGGRHVSLPLAAKTPWQILRNVRRLRRVIAEHRVSVVHARSRAPAWSARAAARRSGVPFVTTFHGRYGTGNRAKTVYNSVMARGDLVISVSDFMSGHIRQTYGVAPERLRRIYRGVDLDSFDPDAVAPGRIRALAAEWRVPEGAKVVMLAGRASRMKGQHVLIEAVRRLADGNLRAVLAGAGEGGSGVRAGIERRIRDAGLAGTVVLAGVCRDMPAAYALADVVAVASVTPESFGRVTAEAQAMGRPTIATGIGPSPEIVAAGRTGWLVPPGDPDSLACAIRTALAMGRAEREVFGGRARRRVAATMSKPRMCEQTLDVYRELLGRDRA